MTELSRDELRAWHECNWGELVLRRHGWTGERLRSAAFRVANDYLTGEGAYVGDRFEDLVSFLVMKGIEAAHRFRPDHATTTYGSNGGNHFDSWICDIMALRCVDWYRRKSEGNGDARHGFDNRVEYVADDPGDNHVDADKYVTDRRRARWTRAANRLDYDLDQWMAVACDAYALATLGPESYSVGDAVERVLPADQHTTWSGFELVDVQLNAVSAA